MLLLWWGGVSAENRSPIDFEMSPVHHRVRIKLDLHMDMLRKSGGIAIGIAFFQYGLSYLFLALALP